VQWRGIGYHGDGSLENFDTEKFGRIKFVRKKAKEILRQNDINWSENCY